MELLLLLGPSLVVMAVAIWTIRQIRRETPKLVPIPRAPSPDRNVLTDAMVEEMARVLAARDAGDPHPNVFDTDCSEDEQWHYRGMARAAAVVAERGTSPYWEDVPEDARGLVKLSIKIDIPTQQIIRDIIDREGYTLTEAVRRAIGYGGLLYRIYKRDGRELFYQDGDIYRRIEVK